MALSSAGPQEAGEGGHVAQVLRHHIVPAAPTAMFLLHFLLQFPRETAGASSSARVPAS